MDGLHYVVFDLETRKLADEVGGWDALKRGAGGITAICVYDSKTEQMYMYDEHTLEQCAEHLERATLVVGFNSEGFDVPVIEGLLKRKLRLRERYDILRKIWAALRAQGTALKGNRLHDVGLRTVGRGKTGDGAHAPQLAKEGRWAELFQYCTEDVRLTHDIFKFIRRKGGVNDASGHLLNLGGPDWLALDDEEDQ